MTRVLLGTLAALVVLLVPAFVATGPSTSGPSITLSQLGVLIADKGVESAVLLDHDHQVQGEARPRGKARRVQVTGPFHASYPSDDATKGRLLAALKRSGASVRVDEQTAKGIVRRLATIVLPILLLANLVALLFAARSSGRFGKRDRSPGPVRSEPVGIPVGALLAAVGGRATSPLGRELTEGERAVLGASGLAWRLRWMVLRRTDDDGNVVPGFLREALEVKRKLFPLERYPHKPRKATPNPGSNWLSIGPRNINGRIRALAIHPQNPQILYAGAAAGGVWQTQDGGRSWRPMMHQEKSLAIGALAIDPQAPETIYAGTGEAIYPLSGPADTPDPMHAWWYEGVGVLQSTDGGRNWNETASIDNDHIHALAVDPHDSSNVLCAGYAAAAGKGGLCGMTGSGWTTVLNGIFTDVLFDATDEGTAYAAQHGGGVFKSDDHGQTWQPMSSGLGDVGRIGRISLTLAAANPSVLYAQVEEAQTKMLLGVYRYSAAEGEWIARTKPGVYEPGDTKKAVYWCSMIAADPTDGTGNTVWSGGTRIAVSRDGGETWQLAMSASDIALPHSDFQDAAFVPGDPDRIIVATDGGVFSGLVDIQPNTDAVNVEWEKISAGLVVTQFYDLAWSPACESRVGGGSQDNGTLVTTGGRSWRQVLDHDGGYVAFHPSDPYVLFAQKPFAYYWRSDDGGADFDPFSSGIDDREDDARWVMASALAIDATPPQMLFGGTDRVYRSKGTTARAPQEQAWKPASGEIGAVTEIAIAPSDPAIVYAGTIDGKLYRADDGGATADSFKQVVATEALPARWLSGVAVHPDDPDTVFVTFLGRRTSGADDSDHVWKGQIDPQNLTSAWQMRSSGLLNVPVGALVIDPDAPATGGHRRLYVACDVGVFRSTDDGVSWAPFEAGLPNVPVVDLALDRNRRILYAATHGRGVYKLHLAEPCADVALCIRDNLLDTADVTPSPSGVDDPQRKGQLVARDQSPDIKVFPATADLPQHVDGIEFDAVVHTPSQPTERILRLEHTNPVRKKEHKIGVQVHNFGWQASGEVTVKLLWAPISLEAEVPQPPPLPAAFWQTFPGDAALTSTGKWRKIGEESVTQVLPDTPWVAVMEWKVPDTAPGKACLLAIVDADADPVKPESELLPAALAEKRRQVAYRLVDIVDEVVA